MTRTSLVVKTPATKWGGPGLILGQEARFHMLQQRSKIPPAKTWCSQINRYIFLKGYTGLQRGQSDRVQSLWAWGLQGRMSGDICFGPLRPEILGPSWFKVSYHFWSACVGLLTGYRQPDLAGLPTTADRLGLSWITFGLWNKCIVTCIQDCLEQLTFALYPKCLTHAVKWSESHSVVSDCLQPHRL